MGQVEFGRCDICHNDNNLERTYFRYDIKCECHSPYHFELIRHCSDCIPKEPTQTIIHIKTEYLSKSSI